MSFLTLVAPKLRGVIKEAARLGIPSRREVSLDFGCGIGRVTRAFASYFTRSAGVDISEKMVEMARGLTPQCAFQTLAQFDFPKSTFDLIYSNIVLQHQPSKDAVLDYVAKFLNMLQPGGLAVFQLPSHIPFMHRFQPRRRVYRLLRMGGISPDTLISHALNPIRMIGIPKATIVDFVKKKGGIVQHIDPCRVVSGVVSYSYYCSH